MALPSAIKLFINPRTGLAFGNFNGSSQITNPVVTLGDTARFELYLVEDTGLNTYPRQEVPFPGSPGIRVAVGPIDESPLAGTWTVSFGGDTTSALAYNITAAALATALNALASITAAGGVTVSKIADNYNIVFNENGARGEITTNPAALIPLSAATVAVLQVGTSTRPQIALVHLQRTIAGLATSFSPTAASAIAIESLSAWNGSRATYRASIAPDPKGGSFTLAFDAATGTDVSSPAIAVGASAVDVQNALNLGALVDKVSVTQVGAYAYDITVTAEPGTNGLTASGAGLISFSGYVGELSLNTAEAISLLDGAASVQTTLEVEITSDSKTLTILQLPCTLQNAVIDAGAVEPLVLDTYLSQSVADGRYARQANNLSDLADINAARTNLGVYSSSSIDSALSLKANLAGATFSGNIVRDNGIGQTIIGPDSVSFSQTGGGGSFVTYGSTAITFPDSSVQSTAFTAAALDGKADLAGATFSGKVNFTSVGGAAGLNVGIGGTSASATSAGDLWITTGGASLNFRDGTGAWRILAATSNTNSFSAPQIIDTTSTTPALRVTQKGTGEALRIEDETNPDATPSLIIDSAGRIGIQTAVNTLFAITISGANVGGINLIDGAFLNLGAGSGGIQFNSSTLTNINTQSNPFTSGSFGSSEYPSEVLLTIGGTVYAVPARAI